MSFHGKRLIFCIGRCSVCLYILAGKRKPPLFWPVSKHARNLCHLSDWQTDESMNKAGWDGWKVHFFPLFAHQLIELFWPLLQYTWEFPSPTYFKFAFYLIICSHKTFGWKVQTGPIIGHVGELGMSNKQTRRKVWLMKNNMPCQLGCNSCRKNTWFPAQQYFLIIAINPLFTSITHISWRQRGAG